jgi:hypothetical protein
VENRGFKALEAPLKRQNHELHKVLFIGKIKCAARSGVRSIAGGAIDRSPVCGQSWVLRSISGPYTFDHRHLSLITLRSIAKCAIDRK